MKFLKAAADWNADIKILWNCINKHFCKPHDLNIYEDEKQKVCNCHETLESILIVAKQKDKPIINLFVLLLFLFLTPTYLIQLESKGLKPLSFWKSCPRTFSHCVISVCCSLYFVNVITLSSTTARDGIGVWAPFWIFYND